MTEIYEYPSQLEGFGHRSDDEDEADAHEDSAFHQLAAPNAPPLTQNSSANANSNGFTLNMAHNAAPPHLMQYATETNYPLQHGQTSVGRATEHPHGSDQSLPHAGASNAASNGLGLSNARNVDELLQQSPESEAGRAQARVGGATAPPCVPAHVPRDLRF